MSGDERVWRCRRRFAKAAVVLAALLQLASCGGGEVGVAAIGSDPGGEPRVGSCRESLPAGAVFSTPTVLLNGAEDCDYLVLGTLRVRDLLKIEAGTQIRFEESAG